MMDKLYNRQILAMAAQISHIGRLDAPQASAFKQAKYCGSTIMVDLNVHNGKIVGFAQQVQACALGQAAAAIVAQHIIDTPVDEIKILRQTVSDMLQKGSEPPQGRFAAFSILQPAREYKARHGSILLVLDALVDCIDQIEEQTNR